MKLNKIRDIAHITAKEKGWWDNGGPSFPAIILLIQSEVSEVLEDYRMHKSLKEIWLEPHRDYQNHTTYEKPNGIPTELADIIIRICDYAGHAGIDLDSKYKESKANIDMFGWPPKWDAKDFLKSLAFINLELSNAFRVWTENENDTLLAPAILYTVEMCDKNDIDIWKAIEIKLEYNKTRAFRHGGKKI
jgi:NTP pyrophosphatase (non-canonical NTP hydrolase)